MNFKCLHSTEMLIRIVRVKIAGIYLAYIKTMLLEKYIVAVYD